MSILQEDIGVCGPFRTQTWTFLHVAMERQNTLDSWGAIMFTAFPFTASSIYQVDLPHYSLTSTGMDGTCLNWKTSSGRELLFLKCSFSSCMYSMYVRTRSLHRSSKGLTHLIFLGRGSSKILRCLISQTTHNKLQVRNMRKQRRDSHTKNPISNRKKSNKGT